MQSNLFCTKTFEEAWEKLWSKFETDTPIFLKQKTKQNGAYRIVLQTWGSSQTDRRRGYSSVWGYNASIPD